MCGGHTHAARDACEPEATQRAADGELPNDDTSEVHKLNARRSGGSGRAGA